MKRIVLASLMIASFGSHAFAQQGDTVESLLKEGYEVKAAIPSNAGPGLVLQKGDAVVMCFVAETPTSTEIATQYCKPVH